MSGGDYLRGKLYGEGEIFRGEIFLGGKFPRGQLSSGAIVQGAIIRGRFSSGAIVLEPSIFRASIANIYVEMCKGLRLELVY